jgi:hypothetical protein
LHAFAAENPAEGLSDLFRESVFRYSDLIWEGGPDVYCFGHWHKDQGISDIGGVKFVNVGAVSRGSLNQDNLDRTPKVALLEFTLSRVATTEIPLVVAPASEVFDLEKKSKVEAKARDLDTFIAHLVEKSSVVDPTKGFEDNIRNLAFSSHIKDRSLQYLERAGVV